MQETIVSKDNPKIKKLKKLSQKKYRHELGCFLVENTKIIMDAARSGILFDEIYISEDYRNNRYQSYNQIRKISGPVESIIVSDKLFSGFSSMDTPSGICALYKIKESEIALDSPVVYLNAINDPGNLGTIIRTMVAFGFQNLVIDDTCADLYNPKTIHAAKDAIFKINIKRDREIAWLMNYSHPIYASHVENGEDLDNFKKDNVFCLVLGSESHGISEEILRIANRKIFIPTTDNIESLNVAMAAAIFLYKLKK